MNDSGFVVVFNILESGYRQWWFPACGLLMIPIGLVILFLNEKAGKDVGSMKFALIGFACLWSAATFMITFKDYWHCSHVFASGEEAYVEGVVDHFVPMPAGGHGKESFTVKGVPFSYSDSVVEAGFNNTSTRGGPIRQGLPVRIWYVGNEIVKLEVKR